MSDGTVGYREEQNGTVVSIFLGTGPDEGFVGLVLRDAPLIEWEGQLQPGIRMSPLQSLQLCKEIMNKAYAQMRCEATNEAGMQCLLNRRHELSHHVFEDPRVGPPDLGEEPPEPVY